MYFSVRKPQATPVEPEDQPDGPEALTDGDTPGEPDEEADVDEAPAAPRPALRVVWDGCKGPSRWLTRRLGFGPSASIQCVAVWACGYYGPIAATSIIGSWTLAVLAFIPREDLHRAAAAIERLDARRHAPETLDEEPDETPASPIPGILWKLTGDAPGVHLKTVAQHLTDHTPGEPVDRAGVRAKLGALGIPVRGSVRDAAGKVNEGVHRDDLTAWEEALSPTAPADPSLEDETGVATPVTSSVGNEPRRVATPLLRLRRALSREAD